jgi:hypothetical protein
MYVTDKKAYLLFAAKNGQRGQVYLIAIVFFAAMLALSGILMDYMAMSISGERRSIAYAQALALAEGGIDLAAYRLNQNVAFVGETVTDLGVGSFSTSVSSIDGGTKRITSVATSTYAGQTKTVTVTGVVSIDTNSISFHYGVQAGAGGFELNNSSSITGNVFSSGPVIGSGGSSSCGVQSGNGNCIYGDVVSTGATGQVYGIHATGTVYAHTLGNASTGTTVEKDAYYTIKTNTTVRGALHPGYPDQGSASFPISDAQVEDWEAQAAAGGIISACDASGNYTVNSDASLGPVKILCNLIVKSSSATLTVNGPIWVVGNITTQTGPTIKMAAALGGQNVAIIADNPSDPTGSGIITVGQSTVFQNSGSAGSFVFLISQNTSAEEGGSTVALSLSQGASALVAYAAHGLAALSQSVSVKEVTAYKITLSQSANVVYDTGLPNTLFETGPGGSWSFVPGTYAIVQ